MKPKQKTIQGKELIKQVSEISSREDGSGGYHQYEVEDILKFLSLAIANNARQGYNTTLKGVGTFKYKQGYSLRSKSNITGEEFNVITKNSLSLKIDSYMRNLLNEQVDIKNALNTGE